MFFERLSGEEEVEGGLLVRVGQSLGFARDVLF